jgi:tripartite-type tricarboxylate transporter receptor subunit TctC
LLANNVDLMMTTAPPLVQHINTGKIKALVVSAKERLTSLPNVPAAPQVGLPNFDVSSWFAIHTHAQAPKAAVERVAAEIQKIMATPAFKERALSQGAFPDFLNPAQMQAFTVKEFDRWGKVIRDGKIKAD